ncbi:Helix-hairpin-helix motif protein [Marinomonas gallaica]|uniref:Helix-hairpin-helix motif protein n=1 Tax=Marinomonas gallaica TaxID=1806667 RepID=A0A1C3JQ38_9GAMM|nr:helix-hairpin-helix domain-containing protein [Marinomonas gallaica]SBT17338.1 Helix-hairpin-helix motif protein [Marinomonas gallaica]SBT22218.1 Helix-hairpin-helix motif protein [Marinomonas gallaica]
MTTNNELSRDIAFSGHYSYKIQDDRVVLCISQITNHRPLDNISGTLAIELRGYHTDGHYLVLASTTIGQLTGQHLLADCHYDLVFQMPPAGSWQLALEVHEWEGEQYVLMDQQFFERPYYIPEAVPCSAEESPSAPTAALKEEIPLTDAPVDQINTKSESKPAIPKASKNPKTSTEKKATEKKAKASINKSSQEELLNVKGIPKKVVNEMIEQRPFSSWEAVLLIKGMGPKLLKKLRNGLKLN